VRINRPIRRRDAPLTDSNLAWDAWLDLDGREPLHVRLTSALRDAIRAGRLPSGSALPPSRQLAADIGYSRSTVTEAYEQLIAEGYLEARVGSATRVRSYVLFGIRTIAQDADPAATPRYDLRPGWADLQVFPRLRWIRAYREAVSALPASDLAYPPSGGNIRLRRVIAEYLHRVRGADADVDNVTITTGILDGVTQLGRSLVAGGHRAIAVEDPAWSKLFQGIELSGLGVVPIPVDSEGMVVDDQRMSNVRAALVAPAHQFPLGMALSPSRRAALLDWARRVDGLILEDDYDAEFRYDRRPVGALQGMAPDRVALFGSLSKTLAPALGLGWCVTPPKWTTALRSGEPRVTGPSTLEQLTLARFIQSGAYDRHLRSVRRRFRTRRDRLAAAITRVLPDCRISGAAAGMHFVVELPHGVLADSVVSVAALKGLQLSKLDSYWFGTPADWSRETFVIGYGNLADELVEEAVDEFARAIRECQVKARVGSVTSPP
jgi:GntR family transcriptional regulator / MocR family aminotransferase